MKREIVDKRNKYFWLKSNGPVEEIDSEKYGKLLEGGYGYTLVHVYGLNLDQICLIRTSNKLISFRLKKEQLEEVLSKMNKNLEVET